MEQNKEIFFSCHELLQNVLIDAFNVPVEYFTAPYKDISRIDQGIRAAVWTNYNDQNTKINFSGLSLGYRILIVKSNLGFYNVLIFSDSCAKPDFISIGPFRKDELSANYFTQILKEAHITPATIQRIKHIYENMPFASVDTVINVTKHILGAFIPEFKEITPELFQYSEQNRAIEINTDLLETNFIKSAEQYHELLLAFLKLLKTGDNAGAKKALQTFLFEARLTSSKNMHDKKMFLHALNNYCHLALLESTIHPSHILKQSASIRIKIEDMTSLTMLEQMPNEICHKYCLLVKNYANSNYSKITKDVIAYIQLHLEEELTLSSLASHFNKNASVLSNVFSKETGLSLTKFIHQTRIQEAIRLFNTTDNSVSEVATAVGYQDFSYFSKVFSKNIGCSPREYKNKQLN